MDVLGRVAGLDPDDALRWWRRPSAPAWSSARRLRPAGSASCTTCSAPPSTKPSTRATGPGGTAPRPRLRPAARPARRCRPPSRRTLPARRPGAAAEAARYSALAGEDAAPARVRGRGGHFERALAALAALRRRRDGCICCSASAPRSTVGPAAAARTGVPAAAGGPDCPTDGAGHGRTRPAAPRRPHGHAGPRHRDAAGRGDRGTRRAAPAAAQLLAARARTLHHGRLDDRRRRRRLADRAVRLAREGGDPATIAACLLALHDARWRPGSARSDCPSWTRWPTRRERAGDGGRRPGAPAARGGPRRAGRPARRRRTGDVLPAGRRPGHPHARWNALAARDAGTHHRRHRRGPRSSRGRRARRRSANRTRSARRIRRPSC